MWNKGLLRDFEGVQGILRESIRILKDFKGFGSILRKYEAWILKVFQGISINLKKFSEILIDFD